MILPCDYCGEDCKMQDDTAPTDVWLCGSCDEDGYDDGVDHLIARGIEDFDFDDEA